MIISMDTLIAAVGSLAAVAAVLISARTSKDSIIRENDKRLTEFAAAIGSRVSVVETKVGFLMGHFGINKRHADGPGAAVAERSE